MTQLPPCKAQASSRRRSRRVLHLSPSYAAKRSQFNNAHEMSEHSYGLKQLSDGDGDFMSLLGALGRSLPAQITASAET